MTSMAKLYGLVLSGGKSTRMGADKGLIAYHNVPQREYLYHLLNKVCDKTFLSIRAEQQDEIDPSFQTILDEDVFRGPFNGLLSAHKKYPEVAWLVLACDMPLINETSLEEMIDQRNHEAMATAYSLKDNPLPEPLFAIWEREALSAAIPYLEAGAGSCPRKFLIRNNAHLIFPKEEHVLMNANSKEEYEDALIKLESL